MREGGEEGKDLEEEERLDPREEEEAEEVESEDELLECFQRGIVSDVGKGGKSIRSEHWVSIRNVSSKYHSINVNTMKSAKRP